MLKRMILSVFIIAALTMLPSCASSRPTDNPVSEKSSEGSYTAGKESMDTIKQYELTDSERKLVELVDESVADYKLYKFNVSEKYRRLRIFVQLYNNGKKAESEIPFQTINLKNKTTGEQYRKGRILLGVKSSNII